MGDTSRDKKIVLYADTLTLEHRELAARLEDEGLPEGIRMIQVRSFDTSYSTMPIEGDLYLIKGSMLRSVLEEAPDRLLALELPAGFAGYTQDGKTWGLLAFDAATQTGPATDYLQYAYLDEPQSESFYLCIDAGSPHLEDGAAWTVALNFLKLVD